MMTDQSRVRVAVTLQGICAVTRDGGNNIGASGAV
jgi:hypothetical protein